MKNAANVTLGFLTVLSLAMMFAASSFGQTAKSEQYAMQKKLSEHQIRHLIASAKSPQDHRFIAEYYEQQAQNYLNQARAYAAKIAAYERTPYLNSCTMCVTSSNSLEAAVRSLKISKRMADERADEMHRLAIMHEQLADNANPLAVSFGLQSAANALCWLRLATISIINTA
jgi:hypothetical protein